MICIKQVDRDVILPLVSSLCQKDNPSFYYLKEGGDFIGTIHVAYFSDDNQVVGCLSMSISAKRHFDVIPQYKIDGIAVKENFRGQGIGFALVKMAEFVALNNEVRCVWLYKTPQSEKYFLKQGFEIFKPSTDESQILVKYPEEHCCSSCESCKQNSVCNKKH